MLTNNSDAFGWNPSTPYWNTGLGTNTPGVGVNRSGGPVHPPGFLPQFDWPDDTVWMHPSGLAVVSWLAPTTGIYDIHFTFTDIDSHGGDGVQYFVDLNGSIGQLATGTLNGNSSGLQSLTGVLINSGDRLNFIVDRRSSSDFDSTTLTATIQAVPEPASLTMYTSAIVFCLYRGVYRHRATFRSRPAPAGV